MSKLTQVAATSLAVCLVAGSCPTWAAAQSGPTVPSAPTSQGASQKRGKRNVIIFVADGLRYGSVNGTDAPTMLTLREVGVDFRNSHALFPTFTTPNASAIATSHYLGDTGDFSNTIFSGYPVYDSGNFGNALGTITPFIENNQTLADLDSHFGGNFLNEETLLELARNNGYNTASVGKVGPVAIQDVAELLPSGRTFAVPQTVFLDDATGSASGIPLRTDIAVALRTAGLSLSAPNRSNGCAATAQCNNGFSGNNVTPGTTSSNTVQQQYFVDALTKAILPEFEKNGKPFAAVYWSRDPDGTQHNQGDSLNKLSPGINGPTSKAAIRNADANLQQILAYLFAHPKLAENTDVFLTADHGFATISKHEIDASGTPTKAYAASLTYKDATGRVEVNPGFLPVGFVAIDLAHALGLPLFDPDSQITNGSGQKVYEPVDPTATQQTATVRQHPAGGDGLIGASGAILETTDAKVVIAANGGSDLIYVPDGNYARIRQIVDFLAKQDYVGGLFVDDNYGDFPGALPLSSIRLIGDAKTPRPTIAVNFKTFYLTKGDLLSAVQIADTGLQEGQGMHGSLGRDNTRNNMAAFGPDFKNFYTDAAPVSNADIALTMAHILGLRLEGNGGYRGRVLREALRGGPESIEFERERVVSRETKGDLSTILLFQRAGQQTYFDEGCLVDPQAGNQNPCR
ncbi:MAG: alkaline phosphatase family protein [Acidobacteriaceae bacterium]